MGVSKRTRTILLVMVLLAVALALSGCGGSQQGADLTQPVTLSWQGLVDLVAKALILLNNIIASLGVYYSWGWAIVVFTIIIKLVTLPLTLKQLQSTKATQALQPKIKELQEKYGKDRQKLSEEQMKLYKEAGVNPMGGCLPLVIQMPILYALYQALYVLANPATIYPAWSVSKLQGAPFYWIPNLTLPSLSTASYSGVDFKGTAWIQGCISAQQWGLLLAYLSLPVIMLVTQLILQKMSTPPKGPKGGQDGQTQMMGQMMMFMPVMFGYITLGLPAGLTLYWTTSNILSIIQQYFVTGWGSLGDWVPMLRPKPAQEAVGVMALPSASSTVSEPEKTVKRRRRRK